MVTPTPGIRNSSWMLFLLVVATIDWKSPLSLFSSTNIGRRSAFALAYDARDFRTCKDKKKHTITRQRRKYDLCDWVAEDPTERCKTPILKRKRVNPNNTNRKRKIRLLKINPQKHCGCTCLESFKSSCPVPSFDAVVELHQTPCNGYEQGRACTYEYMWLGCTYEELTCTPITECTCGLFSAPSEQTPFNWFCVHYDYIFAMCDPNQPVPPERGTSCKIGDPQPRPRIRT